MSISSVGIPTMTDNNGKKEWWLNGELHREDGPALEWWTGYKEWYFHGKIHRVDGPAIEYLNGKVHREDGPAVVSGDGYEAWYLDGQLHREDGPAIIFPNGNKFWYLRNMYLSEEDYSLQTTLVKSAI
jgi:hypothetical protein